MRVAGAAASAVAAVVVIVVRRGDGRVMTAAAVGGALLAQCRLRALLLIYDVASARNDGLHSNRVVSRVN